MRLIDADELVRDLMEEIPLAENVHIFKEIIEGQPTAYDIDKVMEELEEEREEILNSNDYESEIINYCLDSFDNAIEIVKRGGKE